LGRFGYRATDIILYNCSIRAGFPIVGVGRGIFRGIVKKGFKEVAVWEEVRVSRCGCILIETLRGANGYLEHVSILLVHFGVWKRAIVEKSCLGLKKKTFPTFLRES